MVELIVYQSLRRPSLVHRPATISNIFSSETTGQIKFKFHTETPYDAGTKVFSNGPGHMTELAATPYMVKPFKNLLLPKQKTDDLGTWYVAFTKFVQMIILV